MADLSKIKLNGAVYDIKDAGARASIADLATVATSGDYDDLIDAPEPEDDEDVEDMLDGFNLDYTTAVSASPNLWQGGSF